MATDTEIEVVATASDEVTDAEYLAWEKGEEPAAVAEEEPAEPVAVEEPVDGATEPEPETEPLPEAEEEPEAPAKKDQTPEWARRRFSTLAQQRDAAADRAAAAEARAAAAEALLAAQGGKVDGEPESAAPKDRVYTQAELDAQVATQAKALAEQTAFNAQCNTLFEVGATEFGEEAFDANLQNLRDVGVISQSDLGFVQDAMETEAPAKVLYHLGQNPEEAVKIAGMSAAKRAVALDRLATQLATPKPKTAKPLSKAPAPIAPVGSARGAKEININDPSLSDDEAFAEFERLDRQRAMGG